MSGNGTRKMPTWRNGRRAAFRSQSLHGGVGSNPIVGTILISLFFSLGQLPIPLSAYPPSADSHFSADGRLEESFFSLSFPCSRRSPHSPSRIDQAAAPIPQEVSVPNAENTAGRKRNLFCMILPACRLKNKPGRDILHILITVPMIFIINKERFFSPW